MAEAVAFEYRIELFTNVDALNKLGSDGWDLVCPGGKDGNYLIFKRQTAGATKAKVPGGNVDAGLAVNASKKKSYKDFL
jgi:hypothetical protein